MKKGILKTILKWAWAPAMRSLSSVPKFETLSSRMAVAKLCEEYSCSDLVWNPDIEGWRVFIINNQNIPDSQATHFENQLFVESALSGLLKGDINTLVGWQERFQKEASIHPSVGLINQILIKIGSLQGVHSAVAYMNSLVESNHFQPDVHTLNSILSICAELGNVESAIGWLSTFKNVLRVNPNIVTMNTIVQMLSRQGDKEACLYWLSKFTKEWKVQADVTTLQQILVMLGRTKDDTTAFQILDFLEKVMKQPVTQKTINHLLTGCRYANDVEGMERWMEFAKYDLNLQVDSVACNLMIDGYAAQGNVEGATRWLQKMQAQSLPVTDQTFGSLLKSYTVARDLDGAARLWDEMLDPQKFGRQPTIFLYNGMLQALISKYHDDKKTHDSSEDCTVGVERWLKVLPLYGLRPNIQTAGLAISFFASADRLAELEEWLQRLIEDVKEAPANSVKLHAVHAFIRAGDMNRAIYWFRQLHGFTSSEGSSKISYREIPSERSYCDLISGFAARGAKLSVLEMLHEMDAVGVNPTIATMNAVLRCVALRATDNTAEAELEYYLQLAQRYYGLVPDVQTFTALFLGCKLANAPHATRRYCRLMQQLGLSLDAYSAHMVCETLGQHDFTAFCEAIKLVLPPGMKDMYSTQKLIN